MPQAAHMWRWHRPDSAKAWEFRYLERMTQYQEILAIENKSSKKEVVDLSAT